MTKSPCVRKCSYDQRNDHCRGCFRNREEISNWWKMTDEEKDQALEDIRKRKAEHIK